MRWRPSAKNSIFTNVALTDDGDVWWEGMTKTPPPATHRLDRQGLDAGLRPQGGASQRALHRAGRPVPVDRSGLGKPARRADLGVYLRRPPQPGGAAGLPGLQLDDGVYLAATMGSETTAAAAGAVGEVRRDPFAMLPFCGYHMGDYFNHWLSFGRAAPQPAAIFGVNWFRTGRGRQLLWPGFGENMRVLKWIVERANGEGGAAESPLGYVPLYRDLNWKGLESFTLQQYQEIMSLDRELWNSELLSHDELFSKLGDKLPAELLTQRRKLETEIRKMPPQWTVAE